MTARFQADQISAELCVELSALDSRNPFLTPAYAEAMQDLGAQAWLFYLKDGGCLREGCFGFLRTGRLNRSLEIHSLPELAAPNIFWSGLTDFCRRAGVSHLNVGSFASSRVEIPSLAGQTYRRSRVEHVLSLQESSVGSGLSSNHRRNIQKAEKAGVCIERSISAQACREHVLLQNASMERRLTRGESVTIDSQIRTPLALVQRGSGEFFRAVRPGQVLSSVLVLRAPLGAYYHSAGTSREGMSLGASQFLILRVAEILRTEGLDLFNLGGAESSNAGLERFKVGFGTRPVHLGAAQFYLGSRLQKGIGAVVDLLRHFTYARVSRAQQSAAPVKHQSVQP